jgi:hypothetical protein
MPNMKLFVDHDLLAARHGDIRAQLAPLRDLGPVEIQAELIRAATA